MSLDVYLTTKELQFKTSSGIFVRENGQTKEISQEEWNAKNPDADPIKFEDGTQETNEVFSQNITHNLSRMAEEAGLYSCLWRPEDAKIFIAKDLIEPLREGLHKLKLNPDKYKVLNPANGWGSYDGLVSFVDKYLDACYKYPDAEIRVCR